MLNTGGEEDLSWRRDGFQTNEGNVEGGSGSVRRSYHRVTGPGYRNFVIVTGREPPLCRHCVPSSITAGPAVTRGPANLSLVPFHGETKIYPNVQQNLAWLTKIPSFLPPSRLKPTLGRNFHGDRRGGREGVLSNRRLLSMCIHLSLAWPVSRVWIMLVTLDLTLFKSGEGKEELCEAFYWTSSPGFPFGYAPYFLSLFILDNVFILLSLSLSLSCVLSLSW